MKQISNSTVKSYPLRHDVVLKPGTTHLVCNIITPQSLVFINGSLSYEGLDNDYQIKEGEIEFNVHIKNSSTIITILTW